MTLMIWINYCGIRDTENLFGNVDDHNYYKPKLVKVRLKIIINIMKADVISKAISSQDYAIFKRSNK